MPTLGSSLDGSGVLTPSSSRTACDAQRYKLELQDADALQLAHEKPLFWPKDISTPRF